MGRLGAVFLLFVAQPLAAQDSPGTETLIAAIEAAGCLVHEGNQASVLAASGLTEDEAGAIVMMMMTDGRAVPDGDNLRLVTGDCQ